MREEHWGWSTSLILLLTLPWSIAAFVLFGWTLIHDGARSLLVLLVPFAAINAFLLAQLPSWLTTRRRSGR
jgi:hypothetical protein